MSEIMTDLKVGGKCKKLVIATMSNKIEMKWLNWNEITLTNILKLGVVREVRHGFFSMKKKNSFTAPKLYLVTSNWNLPKFFSLSLINVLKLGSNVRS